MSHDLDHYRRFALAALVHDLSSGWLVDHPIREVVLSEEEEAYVIARHRRTWCESEVSTIDAVAEYEDEYTW
jgi:hypothetical protein